jgi:hypothetical protein
MTDIVAFPSRPQGVTADATFFALSDFPNPCLALLAILTSPHVTTVPRLNVRAVKVRYGWPMDMIPHFREVDGCDLFTDDGAIAGSDVLVMLAPQRIDAKSALRGHLLAHPDTTKAEALQAVRRVCPRASRHGFEMDWHVARLDVGLTERAAAGRPRKVVATCESLKNKPLSDSS